MKFYSIIKHLSVCVFLVLAFNTVAQINSYSPYSRYGLGDLNKNYFANNKALGGLSYGMTSPLNININNPATYSYYWLTNFEAGLTGTATWMNTSDGQTQVNALNQFNYLAFGMPLKANRWGLTFGAVPMSSIGYNFTSTDSLDVIGRIENSFDGSGGLNRFFLGSGFNFVIDTTNTLAFGFNFNYIFGDLFNRQRLVYKDVSNAYNTLQTERINVNDIGFDFGFQYKKDFRACSKKDSLKNCIERSDYSFAIGAYYGSQSNLNAKLSQLTRTYTGNTNFEAFKDTVHFVSEQKDTVKLPQTIGVGFTLQKKNHWLIGVDMQIQQWAATVFNQSILFQNSSRLAAGFEIIPVPKPDAGTSYLGLITYRIGAKYETGFLNINNTSITDFGINFGFGLPFRKTLSKLNLAFELGQRGTLENNLIQEKYIKGTLGLTINDKWFNKRKYD